MHSAIEYGPFSFKSTKREPNYNAIINALQKEGPLDSKALAEITGISYSCLAATMSYMKRIGIVKVHARRINTGGRSANIWAV